MGSEARRLQAEERSHARQFEEDRLSQLHAAVQCPEENNALDVRATMQRDDARSAIDYRGYFEGDEGKTDHHGSSDAALDSSR